MKLLTLLGPLVLFTSFSAMPSSHASSNLDIAVSLRSYGGLPPFPNADGTTCNEVDLITLKNSVATRTYFCDSNSTRDPNRIIYQKVINLDSIFLTNFLSLITTIASNPFVQTATGSTGAADDSIIDLEINVAGRSLNVFGPRYDQGFSLETKNTLDLIENLFF